MTHFVSVERDISEERRLREQLIHSERLSAVGQLVAGVAHELNNPLQGVMGNLELMIGGEDRPQKRRDLRRCRVAGERAAKIVRNLLSFARKSALDRSVEDLNEIVRATLAWRATDLRANDISARRTVRRRAAAGDREPRGDSAGDPQPDSERGARHARSAAKSGTLHVRTGTSGGTVFVEIADEGPGVPRETGGADLRAVLHDQVRRRRHRSRVCR